MSRKPVTLITGGAGFLGSHLSERFLSEGHDVVIMDNFLTGARENIAHLLENPNVRLIEHDITNFVEFPGELDYILHFASPASPADYLRLPIQTLKVSSLGTHNVLGLALAKGARLLLASTSEVYGDPLEHPQREEYWGNVNPIGFRGVYDEAKRFAEAMVMAYHRTHGLETRIIRIFNTYGPRMRLDDGRGLPNFLRQGLLGEDITIYGDGMQTRSLTWVGDVIEGLLTLNDMDGLDGMAFNLGSTVEVTMLDLAKIISNLRGVEIVHSEPNHGDSKRRLPDVSMNETISWEATTSLQEGLNQLL